MHVNALLIISQKKYIKNQEERDCWWSGTNASVTSRKEDIYLIHHLPKTNISNGFVWFCGISTIVG